MLVGARGSGTSIRRLGVRRVRIPCASQGVTLCCALQVEALQEVLGKLGSRELPALEKRLSWVPLVWPGRGAVGIEPWDWMDPLGAGGGSSPGADGAARSASPGSRAQCGRGPGSGSSAAAPAAPSATSSSSSAPEGPGMLPPAAMLLGAWMCLLSTLLPWGAAGAQGRIK